jgi:hypothetical protein
VGRCRRRWITTTISDPDVVAVDLLKRTFGPGTVELDRVYVGDITYIRTWEGWLYLATVIDLASRRVVGWAMADHMRAELVCDALRMAIEKRRASSHRSSSSASTAKHYPRARTPAGPCSTTSKCSSTGDACTPRSTTSRPPPTRPRSATTTPLTRHNQHVRRTGSTPCAAEDDSIPFARPCIFPRFRVTELQDPYAEPHAITADRDTTRASDHAPTAGPILVRLIAEGTHHAKRLPEPERARQARSGRYERVSRGARIVLGGLLGRWTVGGPRRSTSSSS